MKQTNSPCWMSSDNAYFKCFLNRTWWVSEKSWSCLCWHRTTIVTAALYCESDETGSRLCELAPGSNTAQNRRSRLHPVAIIYLFIYIFIEGLRPRQSTNRTVSVTSGIFTQQFNWRAATGRITNASTKHLTYYTTRNIKYIELILYNEKHKIH